MCKVAEELLLKTVTGMGVVDPSITEYNPFVTLTPVKVSVQPVPLNENTKLRVPVTGDPLSSSLP
jgi:hypothetical protein